MCDNKEDQSNEDQDRITIPDGELTKFWVNEYLGEYLSKLAQEEDRYRYSL